VRDDDEGEEEEEGHGGRHAQGHGGSHYSRGMEIWNAIVDWIGWREDEDQA
jgi:hypothetical protein